MIYTLFFKYLNDAFEWLEYSKIWYTEYSGSTKYFLLLKTVYLRTKKTVISSFSLHSNYLTASYSTDWVCQIMTYQCCQQESQTSSISRSLMLAKTVRRNHFSILFIYLPRDAFLPGWLNMSKKTESCKVQCASSTSLFSIFLVKFPCSCTVKTALFISWWAIFFFKKKKKKTKQIQTKPKKTCQEWVALLMPSIDCFRDILW